MGATSDQCSASTGTSLSSSRWPRWPALGGLGTTGRHTKHCSDSLGPSLGDTLGTSLGDALRTPLGQLVLGGSGRCQYNGG
jgi:hypothetical protein